MNPVKGYTMINFLHWLANRHPEIRNLQKYPIEELLDLVDEFEGGKLQGNWELRAKWQNGFHFLFKDTFDWEGYGEARIELQRIEHRRG